MSGPFGPSSNWRGISYVELMEREVLGISPIESFANDNSTAERILDQITWQDREEAIIRFLGYPSVISTGEAPFGPNPVAYISRQTPIPHPYYINNKGKNFLYCTKINRIQGWSTTGWINPSAGNPLKDTSSGDGNDLPLYQFARMHLGFQSLPYDVLEDSDPSLQINDFPYPDESTLNRYVTKLYGLSSDYITLANGTMKYASGSTAGSAFAFTAGKILVNYDLGFRWELVPQIAVPTLAVNPTMDPTLAAIDNTLGKVNDSPFPGDDGFAAGTLLLMGCIITPIQAAIGIRLYTVEYHMKFFGPGHHKVYAILSGLPNPTNGFVEISSDGVSYAINPMTPAGKHIYDVANFNALFQPPVAP